MTKKKSFLEPTQCDFWWVLFLPEVESQAAKANLTHTMKEKMNRTLPSFSHS